MHFKLYLESSEYKILLLEIRGYTAGSYSWGDHPEIPAKNPCKYASWHWNIEHPETWKLLQGEKIFIQDYSGGSYHEKWCEIVVYAKVSSEKELAISEIENSFLSPKSERKKPIKEHSFILKDYQQMIREVNGFRDLELDDYIPDDHISSEDYWKKMISKSTGGMKKKWDGD